MVRFLKKIRKGIYEMTVDTEFLGKWRKRKRRKVEGRTGVRRKAIQKELG